MNHPEKDVSWFFIANFNPGFDIINERGISSFISLDEEAGGFVNGYYMVVFVYDLDEA